MASLADLTRQRAFLPPTGRRVKIALGWRAGQIIVAGAAVRPTMTGPSAIHSRKVPPESNADG